MTLVLGFVNERFAVLCADHRISKDNGNEIVDDATNKLIVYQNSAALAFQGQAFIDRTPTAHWIASSFSTREFGEAFTHVKERLNLAASKRQIDQALTVAAVTWGTEMPGQDVHAMAVTLSNVLDAQGTRLATHECSFKLHVDRLPFGVSDDLPITFQHGARVQQVEFIRDCISKSVKRSSGPLAIVQTFGAAIAFTAARYPVVGPSCSAVIILNRPGFPGGS